MTKKLKPIKGFRDFYPEDWAFQNWLKNTWLRLGKSFGYQEYEGPLLEPIELYLSKTSEEIVQKQTFKFSKKGKKYVLRPELTPTLARMVAQKQFKLKLPAKWQSYGQFFRYEQPQKGRGRSFFQWNIDLLGLENSEADSEIVALACLSLKNLGLTPDEVVIKLNDRRELQKQKISKDLFPYIDKLTKMNFKKWQTWLKDEGVSTKKIRKMVEFLKSENNNYSDYLNKIIKSLEKYGLADYVRVDKSLVRGLDYYTGIVFEAWSINSSLNRALFGGGRYDSLTQQVGGKKQIPGVGFAVGDLPIYELLKEKDKLPVLDSNPTRVLVTVFSPETQAQAFKTAQQLRQAEINTELYLKPNDNLGDQLDYANDKNIPYSIILGPEEIEKKVITLKNMESGEQEKLSLKQTIKKLSS